MMHKYRYTLQSIVNLVKWGKVVWRYRWWDYGFTLDMIVQDLKLKEARWGIDTHHVGDMYTKKRIQVLLRMYDRYINADSTYDEDRYLKQFLKAYIRNLPRLWD